MLDHISEKPYIILRMPISAENLFKSLADLTRLRSILLLAEEGELCVCELTHALDEIQPKVSRHLALLKEAGLVADRRQGQWVYYRLHPQLPGWAMGVLEATVQGAVAQEPFNADRERLAGMADRPGKPCCA